MPETANANMRKGPINKTIMKAYLMIALACCASWAYSQPTTPTDEAPISIPLDALLTHPTFMEATDGELADLREALLKRRFAIYPKPAQTWVIIDRAALGEGQFKMTIKNVQHELVDEIDGLPMKQHLDLMPYKKGVYFVTVENKDNHLKWTQRICVR